MIMPTKHVSLGSSILGIGAQILEQLTRPTSVTALWELAKELPTVGSFERFVLALDLLFIVGAVRLQEDRIERTA